MRSFVTSVICLFLVLTANTSPVHEYFERPSLERTDKLSEQIFQQVEKSSGWIKEAFANLGHHKRFHASTPNDVTIEDNLIEDEKLEQDFTQVSSVFCEAGKTSGWLQCTDPTGETERSEAEKVCQAHGQTLWTYAPKTSYQLYGFWICAKTRARAGRRSNF